MTDDDGGGADSGTVTTLAGGGLVLAGAALGLAWPLWGLGVLGLAALVLIGAALRAPSRRPQARAEGEGPGLWLVGLVSGMTLAGAGAAWGGIQDPAGGLVASLGGGLLCAAGARGALRQRG